MDFVTRVLNFINDWGVPENAHFFNEGVEVDLEDFVTFYIERTNENLDFPYGDESDDSDVSVVAQEILTHITSEIPTFGDQRVIFDIEEDE